MQLPKLGWAQHLAADGLFNGLVHVRFGFDRLALQRMHSALAQAAARQLLPHACWLPPGKALIGAGDSGSNSDAGTDAAASAGAALSTAQLQRLQQLQPEAEAVARAARDMQERGSQRPLNAEQRQAIAAVVCGSGRAMPYALFGPPGKPSPVHCLRVTLHTWGQRPHALQAATHSFQPTLKPSLDWACVHPPACLPASAGTGKTLTLVECALQLLHAYSHARLLLCAPQARRRQGARGPSPPCWAPPAACTNLGLSPQNQRRQIHRNRQKQREKRHKPPPHPRPRSTTPTTTPYAAPKRRATLPTLLPCSPCSPARRRTTLPTCCAARWRAPGWALRSCCA